MYRPENSLCHPFVIASLFPLFRPLDPSREIRSEEVINRFRDLSNRTNAGTTSARVKERLVQQQQPPASYWHTGVSLDPPLRPREGGGRGERQGWFSYSRCRASRRSKATAVFVTARFTVVLLPPPSLCYSAAHPVPPPPASDTVIVHVDSGLHHRELDIDDNGVDRLSQIIGGGKSTILSK